MITKDNFKEVLLSLNFEETSHNVFVRNYGNLLSSQMLVDFNTEKLVYAQGITADRDTTQNFHHNENFVVFECVCQLIERGYDPRRIVLEPSAGADGRGQTNTFLDILVKDQEDNNYLIIECKTTEGTDDDEFSKAWKKVLHDGGQLFNYFTLFRTEHLCLYASDYVEGNLIRYCNLIILKDENLQFLEDTKKEGYRDLNATSGQNDYFRIWKNTYEQAFLKTGIFEQNSKAYEISTKVTRTFDELETLDDYQAIQRKYNEFATIMRQHNVGSHENAFDKLVNLFLAKIVDEESNKDDLKFNWKTIAFDDYYDFQDRLQSLYTHGMKKFLGEEVTYINENTIKQAFALFNNDPDATRDKIINYFREQKFYSNNDFAFLDVHNKELFLKNMAVLIKIVQMLQDIKLKTETENQFLGDLFEGFLDAGVKQSEGQFFTPIPIVKFLVSSLPLEKIVAESEEPPMVIDYACGAGHFLNEVARAIRPFAEKYKHNIPLSDFYANIVGIEKEYRLSKVAKVSAFMYSQDEIKIVYGDALANNNEVKDGKFKILVANPPYSVKGFLETLTDEEREKYELYSDDLNLNKNNCIETFFIERAKQLLAPGGVCAIILPSSVLSNGSIYIACREIVLKYFNIVAIAEFGSGTFGKTGTNTVTLFMRRKESEIDLAEHFRNRVDAWLKGDFTKDGVFNDAHKLDDYCRHCELNAVEYRQWLAGGEKPTAEIFSEYENAAKKTTKYNGILKKRITNRYTTEQQQEELDRFVTAFIHNAEADKIYYFLLADSVSQPVLIMKSPTASAEMKQFLGYEWSGAKGSEGIKYLGQTVSDEEDQLSKNKGLNGIQTPIFDPLNYDNPEKVNSFIRRNFLGEAVPDTYPDCIKYARLKDMLDFSRVEFDKKISTSVNSKLKFESRWPMISLGKASSEEPKYGANVAAINGNRETDYRYIRITDITDSGELNNDWKTAEQVEEKYILKENDLLFARSGATAGKPFLYKEKYGKALYAGYLIRFRFKEDILADYVFQVCLSSDYKKWVLANRGGSAQPNINAQQYSSFNIPIPPLSVQQEIVSECEAVDNEVAAAQKNIVEMKAKIEVEIAGVQGEEIKLKDVCEAINPSKSYLNTVDNETIVSFIEMAAVSNDGFIESKVDKPLNEVRSGSYKYFAEGDIIIAKITPCMENGKCAIATGLTNAIGMGSSEFHVFRANEEKINNRYLFALLNRNEIRQQAAKVMTGASGHRRVPISFYEELSLTVPSLEVQKQIVKTISAYEVQIAEAKAVIAQSSARKQQILDKYLK